MKRHVESVSPGATVPVWWEPLYEAARDRSICLSKAWIQNWLDVYGSDFRGYWIHWTNDGAVVGGCLLLERSVAWHGFRLRTLYVNATGEAPARTPLAEYNDILHITEFAEPIAVDFAAL